MKIGSININGVNAFGRTRQPGAWEFFGYFAPDVLCLQETKGDLNKVKNCIGPMMESYGYVPYVNHCKGKAGYAGSAILVKKSAFEGKEYTVKAIELIDKIDESDPIYEKMKYYGTGRITEFESEDMYVISVYVLNSGGKDELRIKWDMLFKNYLKSLNQDKKIYVLGDFNVCHQYLDMWNWEASLNTSPGLMDYEISGFNALLSETGFKDSYREIHPEGRKYSWAAPKVPLSKGWRLDYALTNRLDTVEDSTIVSDVRCSDHVYIELITK